MNFQSEKRLVLDYYESLQDAKIVNVPSVMLEFCSSNLIWRGFHPFNVIRGAKQVGETFWQTLFTSLSHCQRRMDVFLAGHNDIKGNEGTWVVSMGHLMGLFDKTWLGIQPTQKLVMLRYCEFHKVNNGKIIETAMFFDVPHFMIQAGLKPFNSQTAAHLVQPGPRTHEGLMYEKQNIEEGRKTKEAIEFMINDLKNWRNYDHEPLVEELRRSWNEDMIWWGPAGIGATYTIDRYAKQHSGPFREGFNDRKFNGHVCRIAEGYFGGFFGWPNLTLKPAGFMGLPASNIPGDMRVIDIYRREGDKLTENWVFIDLLHFWKMQDIDILKNATEKS